MNKYKTTTKKLTNVIDDLVRFRRAILWVKHFCSTVLRGAWIQLTKFSEDTGRSFLHKKFVSAFWYFSAFSNASSSKFSNVESHAKFHTFWPLWKLKEGWARSLYQLLKLYLRPNLHNTFDGHLLRGCWAQCKR